MKSRSLFDKSVHTIQNQGLKCFIHKCVRSVWRAINPTMLRTALLPDNEKRFTRIALVKSLGWGSTESLSGTGSTIDYTQPLRSALPILFQQFRIKKVFDAPCGDFNWMRLVVEDNDFDYVGADIVKPLIKLNNRRYGSKKVRFLHSDITSGRFPDADVWICRDCLFHLSFGDTYKALTRFVESEIPYLLTTTHKELFNHKNTDIVTGDFRLIDLFESPYNFPGEPLFRVDDYVEPHPPREMCLWTRQQVEKVLVSGALKSFSR